MRLNRRETVDGLDTVFYRIEREDFKTDESFFLLSTTDCLEPTNKARDIQ